MCEKQPGHISPKRGVSVLSDQQKAGGKTQTNFIVAGDTSGINENGRGETLFTFLKICLKLMTQLVAKKRKIKKALLKKKTGAPGGEIK